MKRDILIPGLIAVGIHVSILGVPLPKGSNLTAYSYEPLAVSIIHPTKPSGVLAASDTPAEEPAGSKPPAKRNSSLKKAVICKRKLIDKESLKETSAESADRKKTQAVTDTTVVNASEGRGKEVVKGSATEHARGKRSSIGSITYAAPKYKENPLPIYPKVARRKGYEGKTLLRVEVLENGKAGRIEVAASSGFEVLDKAALKSVKGWTFVPGTEDGKKIRQWVTVPVRFVLK